jgi:hypothetical protein
MRRILTLIAVAVTMMVIAPTAAQANGTTASACFVIQYGSPSHDAGVVFDSYFWPYGWHYGSGSFVVNSAAVREDGTAYCKASWIGVRNDNRDYLICPFYANVDRNNNVTIVRFDGQCHH